MVSLEQIKKMYEGILGGSLKREDANRIAYEIIKRNDTDDIDNLDLTDEVDCRIWEELMFLHGIDLQESKNDYLHSDEQIEEKYLSLMNFSKGLRFP